MKRKRKSFHIRKGAHIRTQLAQILYLIGDINYSRIHLVNGEIILMSRTLKWYESRWPSFIRIHKRVLINSQYAQHIKLAPQPRDTSQLIMTNGAELPIARRRLSLVKQEFSLHQFKPEGVAESVA
ncbi:LytR/AlgR family response regulator transcription factor [Spirosoma litoris]